MHKVAWGCGTTAATEEPGQGHQERARGARFQSGVVRPRSRRTSDLYGGHRAGRAERGGDQPREDRQRSRNATLRAVCPRRGASEFSAYLSTDYRSRLAVAGMARFAREVSEGTLKIVEAPGLDRVARGEVGSLHGAEAATVRRGRKVCARFALRNPYQHRTCGRYSQSRRPPRA